MTRIVSFLFTSLYNLIGWGFVAAVLLVMPVVTAAAAITVYYSAFTHAEIQGNTVIPGTEGYSLVLDNHRHKFYQVTSGDVEVVLGLTCNPELMLGDRKATVVDPALTIGRSNCAYGFIYAPVTSFTSDDFDWIWLHSEQPFVLSGYTPPGIVDYGVLVTLVVVFLVVVYAEFILIRDYQRNPSSTAVEAA